MRRSLITAVATYSLQCLHLPRCRTEQRRPIQHGCLAGRKGLQILAGGCPEEGPGRALFLPSGFHAGLHG